VALLNQSLADTLDLAYQTKQAHWNVTGYNFHGLNLLFNDFHGQLVGYVDDFAHRAVSIGGLPLGTIRVAARTSGLNEYPLDALDSKLHINALLDRYGEYTSRMRGGCKSARCMGDLVTAQLYNSVSRGMDKTLWKLTGHQEA
jgi:starvation-inducible DNA-binding protein